MSSRRVSRRPLGYLQSYIVFQKSIEDFIMAKNFEENAVVELCCSEMVLMKKILKMSNNPD